MGLDGRKEGGGREGRREGGKEGRREGGKEGRNQIASPRYLLPAGSRPLL
jgi:hypothetical protein